MARQYGSDEQARRRRIDRGIYAAVCFAVSLVLLVFGTAQDDLLYLERAYIRACNQLNGTEAELPDGQMIIHMIDVGQGDSVLVQCGSINVLVDAGEADKGDDVADYLFSIGVRELDWLVCTHPHSDHIGGVPEVLERMKVGSVMLPDIPRELLPDEYSYRRLNDALEKENITPVTARSGTSYDCDGMTMTVLYPDAYTDCSDLNDMSICLRFSLGELDFLCCGDLTENGESLLLRSGCSIEAEIIKSSHHGSGYSSSEEFLEAVSAELALISCGEGNDYGHPHDALLVRYEKYGVTWKRTDVCGDIRVICENGRYSVEY